MAGGLGVSPQELNVTHYVINLLFGTIGLGGSAGTITSPSRAT
ncbi:hypothetical protein [Bacillus mycoides]|nr:hypothetical protein [Bacillus mycoides]